MRRLLLAGWEIVFVASQLKAGLKPNLKKMCVALLLMGSGSAHAHTASSSFLSVQQDATTWNVAMDVAVRDLDLLLGLDRNSDGQLTWSELEDAGPRIVAAVSTRTHLKQGTQHCDLRPAPLQLAEHGDGPYLRLSFSSICASGNAQVSIDNEGWYDFDPNHRTLLDYADRQGVHSQALLTRAAPQWRSDESRLARVRQFFKQGVMHLIGGYDHLAFLAVLLIALVRQPISVDGGRLRKIALRALGVISAFTLAHSLTLALAATGKLNLPGKPVEMLIAASVLITALLNVSRRAGRHGWQLAFVFGLVHGLGFAGALAELLSTRIDLWSLAAFNLGIEAAQLMIAALLVPLLWQLAKLRQVERIVLPVLSVGVALVAGQWVWVRWMA